MPVVERFEHGQFAGPGLDDARATPNRFFAALHGQQPPTADLVGLAGGGRRPIHVSPPGLGHLGQDLLDASTGKMVLNPSRHVHPH